MEIVEIREVNKIIIGLLLLIFLAVLLWPQNKITTQSTSTIVPNIGIPKRAESIDWGNTQINTPGKIVVLKSKNNPITGDQTDLVKKVVGMEGVGTTKTTDIYQAFENDKGTLFVLFNEREFDYQVNNKLDFAGEKNNSKALASFNLLMAQLSFVDKISKPEVEYFKDEYRAIKSDLAEADYVVITATIMHNNIPMLGYIGQPQIRAEFNFNGELARLTLYNAFDQVTEDKEISLISTSEIKKMAADFLPIFNEVGGKEFVMSTGEEPIKKITAGDGQLVFIFRKSDYTYQPYYLNQGQTTFTTGVTEIIFGVPLAK